MADTDRDRSVFTTPVDVPDEWGEEMRDCDTCVYRTADGCSTWKCEYINRTEAILAYKANNEILRCKDCKNYDLEWSEEHPCRHWLAWVESDDWCCYAERKDDER